MTSGRVPQRPVEVPPTVLGAASPRLWSDPKATELGLVGETDFDTFASWCYRNLPSAAVDELQHFVAWARQNKVKVERWKINEDLTVTLAWGEPGDLAVTFDSDGQAKWLEKGVPRKLPPGRVPERAPQAMRSAEAEWRKAKP